MIYESFTSPAHANCASQFVGLETHCFRSFMHCVSSPTNCGA